jgi:starch synthase
VEKGWQFAIIGSGEHNLEQGFMAAAARYPRQIAAKIGYEEAEAHRFLAAADTIMVPSRFEPCGLTQLYGLRYGTLPIVSPVGGLYNTVSPVNYENLRKGRATGFVLSEISEYGLRTTMNEVYKQYADTACWQSIQRNAMSQDFGWRRAARQYLQLYKELCKKDAMLS